MQIIHIVCAYACGLSLILNYSFGIFCASFIFFDCVLGMRLWHVCVCVQWKEEMSRNTKRLRNKSDVYGGSGWGRLAREGERGLFPRKTMKSTDEKNGNGSRRMLGNGTIWLKPERVPSRCRWIFPPVHFDESKCNALLHFWFIPYDNDNNIHMIWIMYSQWDVWAWLLSVALHFLSISILISRCNFENAKFLLPIWCTPSEHSHSIHYTFTWRISYSSHKIIVPSI